MKEYKKIFDEYMQRSKEELAALLTIAELKKENDKTFEPFPNFHRTENCTDWNHCINPQMDCINCPIRNKPGQYTINKNGSFSTTTTMNMDQFQITC